MKSRPRLKTMSRSPMFTIQWVHQAFIISKLSICVINIAREPAIVNFKSLGLFSSSHGTMMRSDSQAFTPALGEQTFLTCSEERFFFNGFSGVASTTNRNRRFSYADSLCYTKSRAFSVEL